MTKQSPIERVLAIAAERGWNDTRLANEVGCSRQTLSNWKNRGIPGERLEDIADALKVSVDFLLGRAENRESGQWVAHGLSHPTPTVAVRQIDWGQVMSGELPEAFTLEIQDDAMAPLLPRGTVGRFLIRQKRDPVPGRCVLVRDSDGMCYVREYRVKRGSSWQAVASNSAYQPMESTEDGLTILAVMIGHDYPPA